MTSAEEWYIAELIFEITVANDERNVVHRNHILLIASSDEEAYEKAINRGTTAQTTYLNPSMNEVNLKFIGLADLDKVYEPIEDGAEVLFHYEVNVPQKSLEALIPQKERLRVFAPQRRSLGPDYASREIVAIVEGETGLKRP